MTRPRGVIVLYTFSMILPFLTVEAVRLLESKRAFNTCKVEEGATNDDLKNIQNKTIPTTTTGKCFLACMMEKSHLMKDGKYDSEYALKLTEGTLKNRQKKLVEAKMKITTCANKTEGVVGRCEHAEALAHCFRSY